MLFFSQAFRWAHLIRKTIKLALQNPEETECAEFLDASCSIYDEARELRDTSQSSATPDATLAAKPGQSAQAEETVEQLKARVKARVKALCTRCEEKIIKPAKDGQPKKL